MDRLLSLFGKKLRVNPFSGGSYCGRLLKELRESISFSRPGRVYQA
jgi:hypothetical protein